jgi:protoheme IX farnesyltransferase
MKLALSPAGLLLGRLARLTKIRIALLSTFAAATGSVVFASRLDVGILTVCVSVLLLAMGASALNEWQERDVDARMARTRRRPIPAGEIPAAVALGIGAVLVTAGIALLYLCHGTRPALIGLATALWYNAVYTPLKRVTAFAAVPGGLVGMGAPAIGWTAAGGRLEDPRLWALAFFFFIWQVPHFWLLLLRHGREYTDAGLPSLLLLIGPAGLARLTSAWLATAAVAAPLLVLYGLAGSPWTALALLLSGLLLAATGLRGLAHADATMRAPRLFGAINVFACVVMLLLLADAVR